MLETGTYCRKQYLFEGRRHPGEFAGRQLWLIQESKCSYRPVEKMYKG